MIRCYIDEDQSTWDEYIPLLGGAIRSTNNRQTGFSPNMMMLGREVSTPWDIIHHRIQVAVGDMTMSG